MQTEEQGEMRMETNIIITLKCIRILIYLTAGHELTVEKICEMFKEAKTEEPNWLEVSSKLGLALCGQVSSSELYQAWCKHRPSWMTLFQALQKFDGYQQVAKQAKKKAGVYDHVILYPFALKYSV